MKKIILILFISFVFLITPLLFYWKNFPNYFSNETSDWANFGSYYGGIASPFFNCLAFFGIIYTILIQIEQLNESKKVNSAQMEYINKQSNLMEEQIKSSQKNEFEKMVFNLIGSNIELIKSLEADCIVDYTDDGHDILKGNVLLNYLYKSLNSNFLNTISVAPEDEFDITLFKSQYEKFYLANIDVLGHFCRNTYTILKIISESEFDNKKLFTDALKATLSNSAIGILAYNSLSNYGDKLKILIEEFGLLQNFSESKNVWIKAKEKFSTNAFK